VSSQGLPPAVCSAYDEYALLHYAPAPDVRYVWLVPGPNFKTLTIAAGSVGVSSIGLALGPDATLWSITSGALPIGLAAIAGATFAVGLARQLLRLKAPVEAREVHMAIVPWGVILDLGSEPRILRWPAVRRIDVAVKHTLDGGTPSIVSSVVTVRTDREAFSGYAHGAVGLETLMANVEAYANEASRPLSTDLDGHDPLGDGEISPMTTELVRHAHDLCSTGWGAAELELPPGGYRAVGSTTSPETLALLGRVLDGDVPGTADPRPLAALVAALLQAKELGPTLVRLANRPHPLVAAVARAAALRLGVAPAKAGSVDELSEFLSGEDRDLLEEFATGATLI
jgi:hypothetical protein